MESKPLQEKLKKKESRKVIDTENRLMFAKGIVGENKMGEGGQKVQVYSYKTNKLYDIMYRMVTVVNSTILYI